MKHLLPLMLLAAAAAGATRPSSTSGPAAPVSGRSPSAPRADPPWVRDGLSAVVDESLNADGDEDRHAGLYAGAGPHVGLYGDADALASLHGGSVLSAASFAAGGDTMGQCSRGEGAASYESDADATPPTERDPHTTPLGRDALLQAGLEPRAVSPSTAANGHTIAQLHAQRANLNEHRVRIRATVIKRTDGILGKTYLHVWDGSAAPDSGEDDLTATTTAEFLIGETVELEGLLQIDQDIGLGYRYAVLLDGATRVTTN